MHNTFISNVNIELLKLLCFVQFLVFEIMTCWAKGEPSPKLSGIRAELLVTLLNLDFDRRIPGFRICSFVFLLCLCCFSGHHCAK